MGIYIFNWKKLREYLIADENDPNSSKDFGKNIIPNMLAAGEKLWPYRFDGYCATSAPSSASGTPTWICWATR